MYTQEQIEDGIANKVEQARSELSADAISGAAYAALGWYSLIIPKFSGHDCACTSARDYALPAAFIHGVSSIVSVEYPSGSNSAAYLAYENGWAIYWSVADGEAAPMIRLANTPSVGQTIRVIYTTKREFSDIPADEAHFSAICTYGAADILRMLAAKYAGYMSDMLPQQTIVYRSKAKDLLDVAERMERMACALLSIPPGAINRAALGWITPLANIDTTASSVF